MSSIFPDPSCPSMHHGDNYLTFCTLPADGHITHRNTKVHLAWIFENGEAWTSEEAR